MIQAQPITCCHFLGNSNWSRGLGVWLRVGPIRILPWDWLLYKWWKTHAAFHWSCSAWKLGNLELLRAMVPATGRSWKPILRLRDGEKVSEGLKPSSQPWARFLQLFLLILCSVPITFQLYKPGNFLFARLVRIKALTQLREFWIIQGPFLTWRSHCD